MGNLIKFPSINRKYYKKESSLDLLKKLSDERIQQREKFENKILPILKKYKIKPSKQC
ncbi:hypothetical protein [Fictibacillus barbaricus]|uniref:Uncharacterized protein n=1 Tax=Fictibacillus barbaricus TaxID=182136 RepID=A0ABU1U5K3_9BACL|nr:hypothetical protein [Fictibacillus barbaricus]MDR7074737.1 hypothetical protein [Fictibacillus barbaricus]